MSGDLNDSFSVDEAVTTGIRHIGIAVYSSGKILRYLMNKGYSLDVSREAVDIIINRGYIDDYKAGRKVINARTGRKQESKSYIYQRLINDGISKNIARELLDDLNDDKSTCCDLLLASFPNLSINSVDAIYDDLLKKGKQRGYSSDTISIAIRELMKRL